MFREYQGAAPANVRSEKIHLNYSFGKETSGEALETYRSELKRLEQRRKESCGRGLRSDAVTAVDCVIQMPKDYSPEHEKEFFRTAYDILRERHGNPLWATVHMDEGRPHLHFGFMPIDSKGNLNCKDVINPEFLSKIHDEIDQSLRERLSWYHGGIVHEDKSERLTARLRESHTREFRDQVVSLREMRDEANDRITRAEQEEKKNQSVKGLNTIEKMALAKQSKDLSHERETLAQEKEALQKERDDLVAAQERVYKALDSLSLIEDTEKARAKAVDELEDSHDALVNSYERELQLTREEVNEYDLFRSELLDSFERKGLGQGWKDKAYEEVERVWDAHSNRIYSLSHDEVMKQRKRPDYQNAWALAKEKVKDAFLSIPEKLKKAVEKVREVVSHPLKTSFPKENQTKGFSHDR